MGAAGIALLTSEESLRLTPYNDPRKFATVGWGHLIRRGPVEPADLPITREQALAYLKEDLRVPEAVVNECVITQLTQNQFDAIVDFVYNVGAGNFRKSSLLRYLNSTTNYDPLRIQHYLGEYDTAAHKVLPGLVTRRAKEAALFNTP